MLAMLQSLDRRGIIPDLGVLTRAILCPRCRTEIGSVMWDMVDGRLNLSLQPGYTQTSQGHWGAPPDALRRYKLTGKLVHRRHAGLMRRLASEIEEGRPAHDLRSTLSPDQLPALVKCHNCGWTSVEITEELVLLARES